MIEQLVNTDRYPILKTADSEGPRSKWISTLRSHLLHDGFVTLPQFLTDQALHLALMELKQSMQDLYLVDIVHNIYLDPGDPDLPADHIRNKKQATKVGSLAYDKMQEGSVLRSLYEHDDFKDFIKEILDLPCLYRAVDPMGACSVNVYREGWKQGWHFDETHFSTNILLQTAEAGGHLQLTQPIRTFNDTHPDAKLNDKQAQSQLKHYDLLCHVVDGKRNDLVETMDFQPGTLCILLGSRCLHQITEVSGSTERMVAVFCFATRPGVHNSPQVQQLFWGRVKQQQQSGVSPASPQPPIH